MRTPVPFPEGATESLRLALRRARTKGQHQLVLCVWMRAVLHWKADVIAQALNMTAQAVRKVHSQYLHEGEAIFKRKGKGGRRGRALSVKAERDFLEGLLRETQPANALLDVRFIHESYEKMAGHAVSSSVVYRLLRRHNWRRLSSGTIVTPERGWARARLLPEDEDPAGGAEFQALMRKYTGE